MSETLYNMMLSMVDTKANHQKYYVVKLVKENDSYIVECLWGRQKKALEDASRANRVWGQSKYITHSTLEAAKIVFDKVVQTRYDHGYNPTLQTE